MTKDNFNSARPRLSLAFANAASGQRNPARPGTLSGSELRKIVAEMLG